MASTQPHVSDYTRLFGTDADEADRRSRAEKRDRESGVLIALHLESLNAQAQALAASIEADYRIKQHQLALDASKNGLVRDHAQYVVRGKQEIPEGAGSANGAIFVLTVQSFFQDEGRAPIRVERARQDPLGPHSSPRPQIEWWEIDV